MFSFLPTATLPTQIYDVLNIITDTLSLLSSFLPVGTAITIIELVLGIETAILTYKIANDIFNKLRGSGG
jgi:hypothetical protein